MSAKDAALPGLNVLALTTNTNPAVPDGVPTQYSSAHFCNTVTALLQCESEAAYPPPRVSKFSETTSL